MSRIKFKGDLSPEQLSQKFENTMSSIGFDSSRYSIYGANIYLNVIDRDTGEIIELCNEYGEVGYFRTGQFKKIKKEKTEKKSSKKKMPDNVIPIQRAKA